MLLINPSAKPQQFEVPVTSLPLPSAATSNVAGAALQAYDIWAQKAVAPIAGANISQTVGAMDSAFLILSTA